MPTPTTDARNGRAAPGVFVAAPAGDLPGADLHVSVVTASGGVTESRPLPVLARYTNRCGCQVIWLDRAEGGVVAVRVDERPARGRPACAREHDVTELAEQSATQPATPKAGTG